MKRKIFQKDPPFPTPHTSLGSIQVQPPAVASDRCQGAQGPGRSGRGPCLPGGSRGTSWKFLPPPQGMGKPRLKKPLCQPGGGGLYLEL